MKVFATGKEIREHYRIHELRQPGLVPTMGALHEGHLSLVRAAAECCRMVAVSIFVNPTQFNDPEDLVKYPRTPEADLQMLSEVLRENDFVFTPSVEEIYPESDTRVFDLGEIGEVMEGAHRPGHFNGVAQVVSRLFDIVRPSAAFFGQKDYQQLTIIRELARRHYPKIEIIACPIVRESDGLAMSSRNKRLLPRLRERAGEIYRTLIAAAAMASDFEPSEIKDFVADRINMIPDFRLEYFEIVEDATLKPVASVWEMSPEKSYYGCIALWAGEVRLIDNIEIGLR
ncbi:MAG: pantoate--beta-alanine ligase [Bacteroidales bacterium]|nr:pantoate--beta-alanine ligase [Bacteroidales bacterium]MDT8373813.1 pantoate--beta-alanine ligase [Bacteroidales bacterium]